MTTRALKYPTAIATFDDTGIDAAISWCRSHLTSGDTLSIWTYLKSNLREGSTLARFVARYSDVEHVTGRGGTFVKRGPVLMVGANMDDIGQLVQFADNTVTALCIVAGNDRTLRPWVAATDAKLLGADSPATSAVSTPQHVLHPVVVEALTDLTEFINLSNTIGASGYDKDDVVSTLLALYDAGIPMNGAAMQGWVLAHGWSGSNPQLLAGYVDSINAGRRPRAKPRRDPAYVDQLRARVVEANH